MASINLISYKNNNNLQYISQKSFNANNSQNLKFSPFIVEGEFLEQKPLMKSKYSLQNYVYLTDSNNNIITIGQGGYGKLYLSKNKLDNKEYAIKNISKKKMKEVGVDISIIKREIDVHIRITHPHIIKLYSSFEDRNYFYLLMEYAKKGNLYQLIQKKKGLDENEAFHYFIQVVSAIHFLHMNGYAHRDIKPENILLDRNGQVKLCDFGWCVNVSKGERITFCGTYEYMAPEMINDEFYDMGIDIWSLGVLLYEMIHGYSPFRAHYFLKDAKSAMKEIFMNIKNNNYVIERNISEECKDLIDKLLTIDQKKRIKINEIFLHPWVVNKEKKYFPFFKRIIKDKYNDENIDENVNQDIYFKIDNNLHNNYLKDNNLKSNDYNNININNNNFYYTSDNFNLNSINNGFHFIREKSKEKVTNNINIKNKFKKEELIKRINDDKYKIKEESDLINQKLENKEYTNQNNFIYSINNSKNKKNENSIINNLRDLKMKSNLSEIKINKNNILHININNNCINNNNYNIKNIYIEKKDSKQKNTNETEKEKNQININIVKEKKEEYKSPINLKDKENFSFIYNKPKNNIDSYVKIITKIKQENINRDKRAKSVEQSLIKQRIFFPGNNNIKNNKNNIIIVNNINSESNNNYKQIKSIKENTKNNNNNKEDFLRFRKKVVHIKKRSFLNNDFKLIKKNQKTDDKLYSHLTNIKSPPVHNIFYNTFYNCQFDNNNSINFNTNQIGTYTKNFYVSINNKIRNRNQIKKTNTDFNINLKSFSSQKNFHKNKIENKDKNRVNDLINFYTEKQVGKIFTNRINIIRNENSGEKNNKRYIITKSERQRYITRKVSPYKKKEIFISSYN